MQLEFAASDINRKSIFTPSFFTRQVVLAASAFIKPMHPKSEIKPDESAIARILGNGWIGQTKIHGHRAQIHISSDPEKDILAYTRQGTRHKLSLTPRMVKELRRLFQPNTGWNVIDAEWLKPEEKLFVFDFIKQEGKLLRALTFPERFALLPRDFISPHVSLLPLLKDLESCLKVLQTDKEMIEGLVFKSGSSTGFSDSSIVRCRKKK